MIFALKQQPKVSMGISKNVKPSKEKINKMSVRYEGIMSMNHLRFIEINDRVDILYPCCFVELLFPIHAIQCHL